MLARAYGGSCLEVLGGFGGLGRRRGGDGGIGGEGFGAEDGDGFGDVFEGALADLFEEDFLSEALRGPLAEDYITALGESSDAGGDIGGGTCCCVSVTVAGEAGKAVETDECGAGVDADVDADGFAGLGFGVGVDGGGGALDLECGEDGVEGVAVGGVMFEEDHEAVASSFVDFAVVFVNNFEKL